MTKRILGDLNSMVGGDIKFLFYNFLVSVLNEQGSSRSKGRLAILESQGSASQLCKPVLFHDPKFRRAPPWLPLFFHLCTGGRVCVYLERPGPVTLTRVFSSS